MCAKVVWNGKSWPPPNRTASDVSRVLSRKRRNKTRRSGGGDCGAIDEVAGPLRWVVVDGASRVVADAGGTHAEFVVARDGVCRVGGAPVGESGAVVARRRYRDFEALLCSLERCARPPRAVPRLPPKQFLRSSTDETVVRFRERERRRHRQVFGNLVGN